jgi:hypothetical protein
VRGEYRVSPLGEEGSPPVRQLVHERILPDAEFDGGSGVIAEHSWPNG